VTPSAPGPCDKSVGLFKGAALLCFRTYEVPYPSSSSPNEFPDRRFEIYSASYTPVLLLPYHRGPHIDLDRADEIAHTALRQYSFNYEQCTIGAGEWSPIWVTDRPTAYQPAAEDIWQL
jgi:hypothetical protein